MSDRADHRTISSIENPFPIRTNGQLVITVGLPIVATGIVALFVSVPTAWWVLTLLFWLGAGAFLWFFQLAQLRPESSLLDIRRAPMLDSEVQTALRRMGGQGKAHAWVFDDGAGWMLAIREGEDWLFAIRRSVIERSTANERQFLLLRMLRDSDKPFSLTKSIVHGIAAAGGAWAASVNLWFGLAAVVTVDVLIAAFVSWREQSDFQLAMQCDEPLAAVSALRKFGTNNGIPGQLAQHRANDLEKTIKKRQRM